MLIIIQIRNVRERERERGKIAGIRLNAKMRRKYSLLNYNILFPLTIKKTKRKKIYVKILSVALQASVIKHSTVESKKAATALALRALTDAQSTIKTKA